MKSIILKCIKPLVKCTLLLIVPFTTSAQSHSIDQKIINLSDVYTVNDFYKNTYYNAIDSVDVSWEIIEHTMPEEWSFSNCFPSCNPVGVISGLNNFPANSSQYLNCHFYPNNTPGMGMVKMLIITNQIHLDTVTWIGTADSNSVSVFELYNSDTKVYPTATSGIVTIELPKITNGQIVIFSLTGEKVFQTDFNEDELELNLKGVIEQGLYFIQIIDVFGNQLVLRKILYE